MEEEIGKREDALEASRAVSRRRFRDVERHVVCFFQNSGSPTWHKVARKDQVCSLLRACSKNNISTINVFTLTNVINC